MGNWQRMECRERETRELEEEDHDGDTRSTSRREETNGTGTGRKIRRGMAHRHSEQGTSDEGRDWIECQVEEGKLESLKMESSRDSTAAKFFELFANFSR